MKTFKQHIIEGRTQTLIISFQTKQMLFERIYEREFKNNFRDVFVGVEQTRPHANFDLIFKGDKSKLDKVIKHLKELDINNKIYKSHRWE